MFESGAILIYLAEKFGRFLPAEPVARMEVIQWLMFQMGGIGPIFGQVHHFLRAAKEKVPYGIERYGTEGAPALRACSTGGSTAASISPATAIPSPT